MMATSILILIFLTVAYVTATDFTTNNYLFTSSLYKAAIKCEEDNILISPLSAEIILGLMQSGARGKTAEEISASLNMFNSNERINSSFKNLIHNLKNKTDYFLYTSTKIYVSKNFSVKNEFKSIAADAYQSEIEKIDFTQSGGAANKINKLVRNQTEGKIKNLVHPNILNGTSTIIVNTLYFKAHWVDDDFEKTPTFNRKFHRSKSEAVEVQMMNHETLFVNSYEDSELKATFLELPLKGDAYMVYVLPDGNDDLSELEKKSDKIFTSHPFKRQLAGVILAVFQVETTTNFKKIFQELGVKEAFDNSKSDFSGIAGNKGDLTIGNVLQKSYISVDENGVEAAASTDLWFRPSRFLRPNKVFTVDHSFIFYVRIGDVILFAGRVVSPD